MEVGAQHSSLKRWILRVVSVLTGMLALGVAIWSTYLLVVGQPAVRVPVQVTVVPVTPRENIPIETPDTTIVREPYQPAFVPLVASGLLLVGLVIGQLRISWLGLIILIVFSILFFFSVGAGLLPVAAALLILLGIIQYISGSTLSRGT